MFLAWGPLSQLTRKHQFTFVTGATTEAKRCNRASDLLANAESCIAHILQEDRSWAQVIV